LLPVLWLPFFALSRSSWLRGLIVLSFAVLALGAFWGSAPFFVSKQGETIEAKRQTKTFASPDHLQKALVEVAVGEPSTGLLDSFELRNGTLAVRGWAFDRANGLPVSRVWVVSNNKFIASSKIHIQRPDVAKAFGTEAASLSGFYFVVTRLPASAKACDFEVQAEYSNGTLAAIPNPVCPVEKPQPN
jgi:hypothetical protein